MSTTQIDRIAGVSSSLAMKTACDYTTTANITLSGLAVQAGGTWGSTLTQDDGNPLRILVKDQTNPIDNGIWNPGAGTWTRARDFDGARDIVRGTVVHVYQFNGDLWFEVSTANPITIGTSSIGFVASTAASILARLADPTSASNGLGMIATFVGSLTYLGGLGKFLQYTFGRTASEVAGGITPTNYAYAPYNVFRYGAVGDWNGTTGTDDTTAFRNCSVATPNGGTMYVPGGFKYKLTDDVRITKPMTVRSDGPGSFMNAYTGGAGGAVVQTNTAKNAFTLVAATANYAFGQYGITDVHFKDIAIYGRSGALPLAAVGVDTTVNAGDFHIRECSTDNVVFAFFQSSVDFTGTAYLNTFRKSFWGFSTTGVKIAKGAASTAGGQTTFESCTGEFCDVAYSLNEDADGGDFKFVGGSIGDGKIGIKTKFSQSLICKGVHFEQNTNTGTGAAIYRYAPLGANASTSAVLDITGCEFFGNDASLWCEKLTLSSSDGNFSYPVIFDANTCLDSVAIKLTVPSGEPGFGSKMFVIGESNSGTSGNALGPSQVSTKFFGTDLRKKFISKRYTWGASSVSGGIVDFLPGSFVPTLVRVYMTANATGFTTLRFGDQALDTRYVTIANAQTQALNTWVNYTPAVPEFVVDTTSNQLKIVGTGGILSSAGVIEVQGFQL